MIQTSIGKLKRFLRSLEIKEEDLVVPKNSNLFIGGVSGRTGTSWLRRVLTVILRNEYVVISEHGSFVLSQFRNAGYQYYQATKKIKKPYLNYFYKFITNEAFDRRKIYGVGLPGFSKIIPKRAIKLAFNALAKDLEDAQSLQQYNRSFGNFLSLLLFIIRMISIYNTNIILV